MTNDGRAVLYFKKAVSLINFRFYEYPTIYSQKIGQNFPI